MPKITNAEYLGNLALRERLDQWAEALFNTICRNHPSHAESDYVGVDYAIDYVTLHWRWDGPYQAVETGTITVPVDVLLSHDHKVWSAYGADLYARDVEAAGKAAEQRVTEVRESAARAIRQLAKDNNWTIKQVAQILKN